MRKVFVILECVILALGVFLSLTATIGAVKLSAKYIPFFLIAALGIMFFVILIKRIDESFAALLGFALILIYLFVAGSGYAVCSLKTNKMQKQRSAFYTESRTVPDDESPA